MRKQVRIVPLAILAAAALLMAAAAPDLSNPRVILQKTLERNYHDLELRVHLVKVSKSGRERPMDLVVKIKNAPGVKKTLAVFTGPPEIKGISSLSWDYSKPGRPSDRWFKLSGMNYVKCLGRSCQKMEERFGFSTEIFAIKLEAADHKLLGEDVVGGASCYKVESVSKDPDNPDGARFITWVDKDKFVARRIEAYDKSGKLIKVSSFDGFKKLGDHWWETKGKLVDEETGKKLRFEITDARVNAGIADQVFARPKLFSVQGHGK